MEGLEPPRDKAHRVLSAARLPVPPHPRVIGKCTWRASPRIGLRGALAKLAKAPVSKTGDSRFESWVPRFVWLSSEPGKRCTSGYLLRPPRTQ